MRKVIAMLFGASLSLLTVGAAEAEVAAAGIILESAGTASLLQGIRGLVNDAIDKAQNTGNYLLFKGATELKSVIDTWEKANTNLLNKAFRELDDSQRKFFADANSAAQQLNKDVASQVEAATKITELANQTVADVRIFDGNLAVFRYSPRVVYPGIAPTVSFTVRGINFDDADPNLTLPNGEVAKRVSLSKQEAIFSLPTSVFSHAEQQSSFAILKLSYLNPNGGFFGSIAEFFSGRKNLQTTEIAVMQLPQKLGEYSFVSKTRDTVQDSYDGQREFHWSGRNDTRSFPQGPHDNGWTIQISSVHQGKTWGRAGRGCHLISNNQHGFAIEVRTGVIRETLNPNAPGYQHCIWHWKEFKDREVINEQPADTGALTWSQDTPLSLPQNVDGFLLTVKTFNGIQRAITGSQTEPFYRVVEAGSALVIQPQIPNDLNGL